MRSLCRMRDPAAFLTLMSLLVFLVLSVPAGAAAEATCQPGQNQPSDLVLGGAFGPRMRFYTLLDPATCAICPSPPGLTLRAARVSLGFSATCSLTLRVWVLDASGSSSCPVPDRTAYRCLPTEHVISGVAGMDSSFVLPLPDGLCIDRRSFLCVEILTPPPDVAVVFRGTGTGCVPCVQRWEWDGLLPMMDVCHATFGVGMNLAMWVDADCCPLVPTVRPSWGSLKSLYR